MRFNETQKQWSEDDDAPLIPVTWKPRNGAPVPVMRCTATTRAGTRCKRYSLRGATVCLVHGGRLPNVRAHAEAVVEAGRLRLIGMTDEAIDVLGDIMTSGSSDAVRLKAAQDVLDRSGLRGATEIAVEVTHTESAAQRVQARLAEIADRAQREVAKSQHIDDDDDEGDDDIIDAEILDGD